MKIRQVLFSAGSTGFYFDDQKAIKAGARQDGFSYMGKPQTPGFSSIRMKGESVSILAQLENGLWAVGDAAAVQYSGAGGRDPLFLAADYIPWLEKHVRPLLVGHDVASFRKSAAWLDALEVDGKRMHTAIRYGLGQMLLDARAKASCQMMCEVVCEEYGLPVIAEPVPIFGQSGDDRYNNADKMIIKRVDVLPHGLINNVDEKLGRDGKKLYDYVAWLSNRVKTLSGDPAYRPDLHIDVYGTIGTIFNNDPKRVADYLAALDRPADGLNLFIEGPVDMGEREAQIQALRDIRIELDRLGSPVKIVADEWCNTYEDVVDFTKAESCHMVQIKTPDLGSVHNIIDAVLYCKQHGMMAYQGGTCNETDVSARACVHIAIAARAERMLVKPGMGFDEGLCIVGNEMARTVAILRGR